MPTPSVFLLPANGKKCDIEIRLDKAGKPVKCGRAGYVALPLTNKKRRTLCRECFEEVRVSYAKLGPS